MPHSAIVFLVALVGTVAAAQPDTTSVKAVLAAADAYLIDYRKQLTFLLANEESHQEALTPTGDIESKRHTSGDLFMAFIAPDRAWVAVHDVARVDGVPVDGHEDIRRLLERNSVAGVARQLVTRNARFNIGRVLRNFNEPTLALLVLDRGRRSQFKFDRERVEVVDGVPIVTIKFKETERPTLVQNEGRPVYSTGEISIEAGTGRIRRTFIKVAAKSLKAELTTTYAPDQRLGLWLPTALTERYEAGSNNRDVVTCVSTYTNWRRFAATGSFRPITAP